MLFLLISIDGIWAHRGRKRVCHENANKYKIWMCIHKCDVIQSASQSANQPPKLPLWQKYGECCAMLCSARGIRDENIWYFWILFIGCVSPPTTMPLETPSIMDELNSFPDEYEIYSDARHNIKISFDSIGRVRAKVNSFVYANKMREIAFCWIIFQKKRFRIVWY